MLNVTLDKLARSCAQQMFASHASLCDAQRHHVLELIAEAVRAAQLIKSCARPYAAAQRLIEQPAIEQQVHARIGRRDLHCAEHVVPASSHLAQSLIEIYRSIAIHQRPGLICVFRLPQEKHHIHASRRDAIRM